MEEDFRRIEDILILDKSSIIWTSSAKYLFDSCLDDSTKTSFSVYFLQEVLFLKSTQLFPKLF